MSALSEMCGAHGFQLFLLAPKDFPISTNIDFHESQLLSMNLTPLKPVMLLPFPENAI